MGCRDISVKGRKGHFGSFGKKEVAEKMRESLIHYSLYKADQISLCKEPKQSIKRERKGEGVRKTLRSQLF